MVAILSTLLPLLNMTLSGKDHLEIYTTNMDMALVNFHPSAKKTDTVCVAA